MKKRNAKQGEKIYLIKATLSDWYGKVRGQPFRVLEILGNFTLYGLASISTVLEMTNGTADLGEADDKLLVAEPRHGCWGVGKF